MRKVTILGAAALVVAAAAASQGLARPRPAPPLLTPQQVVAARQAAFGLSAGVFGNIKGAVDSGADPKPFGFGARNLAKWAAVLPSMFPAGTALPESKAKPAIWTARADFEAKAAAYAAAAGKLAAAAQAGDKAAFAAAFRETGGACKACHDAYRMEEHH
ncbi:MAG TPA: cytochrome c [Allosphingosinicella sp.]|jgi:cytochrome c556